MKKLRLAAAITALISAPAFATNGYAPIGVGQSAKGIGGAGIAYPQDSLAGGINPAGMVHVGNRWDVGAEIFIPDRGFNVSGTPNQQNPVPGSWDGNGSGIGQTWFLIPEFGYNKMLSDDLSVGISVFGNGGLNTSYESFGHPFSFFNCQGPVGCGSEVGIDLIQLYIAPTVSYKVNERLSVGASLNLIAQSFEASGLWAFQGASRDGNKLTNNGHDNSYGASLRLGLMYEINDRVTLGATYQTKGWMTEFDDYAGLFADGGDFDIPQNYGIGIAIKATDRLDIAMDIMRIEYGSINAIGNSPNSLNPQGGVFLGSDDGPGFGWEDQTIFKIGAVYQYNSALALRAGYNYGENPVNTEGLGFAFNTLAPGVSEHHLTLGFTYDLDENSSITGSYLHAFSSEVDGDFIAPTPQGPFNFGSGELEMSQNAFGISYNKRF
jgi:long-chain fatty acid transport protein